MSILNNKHNLTESIKSDIIHQIWPPHPILGGHPGIDCSIDNDILTFVFNNFHSRIDLIYLNEKTLKKQGFNTVYFRGTLHNNMKLIMADSNPLEVSFYNETNKEIILSGVMGINEKVDLYDIKIITYGLPFMDSAGWNESIEHVFRNNKEQVSWGERGGIILLEDAEDVGAFPHVESTQSYIPFWGMVDAKKEQYKKYTLYY